MGLQNVEASITIRHPFPGHKLMESSAELGAWELHQRRFWTLGVSLLKFVCMNMVQTL